MELKLIDTGYLNINKTGTQLDDSERAGYDGSGGVTTFDILNVISITLNANQNTTADPVIGSDSEAPIQVNEFDNDKYVLSFGVARDYNPVGFQYNYIYQINRLSKTKGIKVVYPSGDGTFNSIINYMAEKHNGGAFCDDTLVPANTNYLPIVIHKVTMKDLPDKKYIAIILEFEIAGE